MWWTRRTFHKRLALALLSWAYFRLAFSSPFVEADTVALYDGAVHALGCLSRGELACSGVQHFPIFQYLLLIPGIALGISGDALMKILGWLNIAAFFAMMTLPRKRFFALFLMGSPFVWYSMRTFNEPVAALLTLSVALGAAQKKNWTPFAVFFAGLTKEIAPPLLLVLLLAAGVREKRDWIRGGLAAALAASVNGAFNLFRFASLKNLTNSGPLFVLESQEQRLKSFWGLLASPSGGLFFFWPACAGALLGFYFSNRRSASARTNLALLLLLLGGLASWYAPFGWIAWGPRLLLPWLPALLYLAMKEWDFSSSLAGRRIWIFAGLFALSALPQIMILMDPGALYRWSGPDVGFSKHADHLLDLGVYLEWLNYAMWKWPPLVLEPFQNLSRGIALVYLVLWVFAAVALFKDAAMPGESSSPS